MGLYLVYEQIVNYFKEKILKKELLAGDSLPSENSIAEKFEVSRGTVRKALKYLSDLGIVSLKRGKKTIITENAYELIDKLNITIAYKKICLMFISEDVYFKPIIDIIKKRIALLGWHCDLVINNNIIKERECVEQIIEKMYDGVVCVPYRKNGEFEIKNYQKLQRANIPFVMIGKPDKRLFCDSVFNDDYRGSYMITDNLCMQNFLKVVYVTDRNMDKLVALDRLNGYIDAMKFRKKEPYVLDCRDSNIIEELHKIFIEYKNRSRIAFNIYSDIQAKQIIAKLEEFSLQYHVKYEIICFRELYNEIKDTRYKTVSVSRKDIGICAINLLKKKIEGDQNKMSVMHILFNIDVKKLV